MAKSPAGPGIYSPWTWRARRLIRQLRSATHRTVQNAIIQELIHELTKGSRRAKRKATWLRAQAKKQARRHASRAGAAIRRRTASTWDRLWFGPKHHCAPCDRDFRSLLQFNAHARAHQQRARQPAARTTTGRQKAVARTAASRQQRAAPEHAHAVPAAGARGRAVAAASRNAEKTGVPLGTRDLKNLAKQVTDVRDAGPQPRTRTAAAKPSVPARGTAANGTARAARAATTARKVTAPAAPRTAPRAPVRPGRT